LLARQSFLRGNKRLQVNEQIFVLGPSLVLDRKATSRGVDVLSLVAERQLYVTSGIGLVDEALELAAALNDAAPGPAAAGGWASIEALLYGRNDPKDIGGVVAADRAALLAACAWPRAELTSLSYRHLPVPGDSLAVRLAAVTENRERARIVATALQSGTQLQYEERSNLHSKLARAGHQASETRMTRLLASPGPTLRDVRRHMVSPMRRLYRCRNIVLHGGAPRSPVVEAGVRVSAPIVGAALDRIYHAAMVENIEPLSLAARAQLSLDMVGSHGSRQVVDLLDELT
jgi:hypothetical protein